LDFLTSPPLPKFLIDGTVSLLFSAPQNFSLPQGRATDTYNLMDNASHVRRRHSFQFGFQSMHVRTNPHDNSDFAGGQVGRPLYGRDLNNFAPNAGLAYEVTGLAALYEPEGIKDTRQALAAPDRPRCQYRVPAVESLPVP